MQGEYVVSFSFDLCFIFHSHKRGNEVGKKYVFGSEVCSSMYVRMFPHDYRGIGLLRSDASNVANRIHVRIPHAKATLCRADGKGIIESQTEKE